MLRLFKGREAREPVNAYSTAAFRLRDVFLQADELKLYTRLTAAVGVSRIVFPKVRAIDVIEIRDPASHFEDAFRLNLKCISFLICDASDGSAVCAIETEAVDSRSNQFQIGLLKAALKSSELPVLRVCLDELPSVETLRATLAPLLAKRESSTISSVHPPHASISAPSMGSDLSQRSSV